MNDDIKVNFDDETIDVSVELDSGSIQYGELKIGRTTTGDPGTLAKVENSGTPSNAVLNFTIPRGEKGTKGDKGDKGDTGLQGAAGKDGAIQYTAGEGIEITSENVINCTSSGVADYNDLTNKPITNLTGTETSPIYFRNLTTGNYLISGLVMPYSDADISDTLTNTLVEVEDTTEYVALQIYDKENDSREYYKVYKETDTYERTVTVYSNLSVKPTVATSTRTSIATSLADNINYQCSNALSKLTINFPSERDNHYKSWITFKTETTSIEFNCSTPSYWYGVDVIDNVFTPSLNKIYYIEFWQDTFGLNAIVRGSSSGTLYSSGYDYAELAEWSDNNPNDEDRLYRFVSIEPPGEKIKIAQSNDYIAGVTTEHAGVVTNMCPMNEIDKTKAIVGILGIMTVKSEDSSLQVNDKVMPNDNGCAVKSTNNLGYRVLEILENNLIKIAFASNIDMIKRIKDDVENKIDNNTTSIGTLSDLTTTEKGSLVGAVNEVNEKNIISVYKNNTASLSSYGNIPLDSVYEKVGTKLSLNNNSIIIGSGIKTVKISAQIWYSISYSTRQWFVIKKNNVMVSSSIYYNTSAFATAQIMPFIISVSEGDKIELALSNIEGTNPSIMINNGLSDYHCGTYLIVEAID
jgi:hypothetical protein